MTGMGFIFGHLELDMRPWTLDIGHWTLDIGHWTLDIDKDRGHWTLIRAWDIGKDFRLGDKLHFCSQSELPLALHYHRTFYLIPQR